MTDTTITAYEAGMVSVRAMTRKYHQCLKKAKELNDPPELSRSDGENAGMKFDALGCAFGGVSAAGGIMSGVKSSADERLKLQLHIYNRSPYVVVPYSMTYSGVGEEDSYRTISFPGPLKPSESGEIEVDCLKNMCEGGSGSKWRDSYIQLDIAIVSAAGKIIAGYIRWNNISLNLFEPAKCNFGAFEGLEEGGAVSFIRCSDDVDLNRHNKNMYFQTVITNDNAYPQFGVAAYSCGIGKSEDENTHVNVDICPWEIHEEAFIFNTHVDSVDKVTHCSTYDNMVGSCLPIALKVWNQVLRDVSDKNSSQNMRGLASAMVPFGNMASAGASMVSGLIQGARALTRNVKKHIPVQVNVKNMTACTLAIGQYRNMTNAYHETSIIPAGEDGSFMLTDDQTSSGSIDPRVGFFFASDDGDDTNIYLSWEKARATTTRLYKVACYDDDGVGDNCVYNGKENPDLYCVWSTAFQVPSPKDANIVVSCTSANNTAEQDLTLVFAQ